MAIISGDLHGNLAKARAFLTHKPEETHVCVGDYVDSFNEPGGRQLQCLELLVASEALLLWGNHDLHYLPRPLWRCNGYQPVMAPLYRDIFVRALEIGRITAACAVDGWLCTHAGVHPALMDREMTADEAAACLNAAFPEQLNSGGGPLFYVAAARGGTDPFGGIFWFDPFREGIEPSSRVGRQVFGHTERKKPHVAERWACIDTVNSSECWIFETTSGQAVQIPY
ncbi:metallophosphoesterase [Geotalea sp. SG265]|uniref:metallophosphoesterase n=1 Tax=Geotalea sp. SG265 TaxID=2922867 RepID=UPI001FAE871C